MKAKLLSTITVLLIATRIFAQTSIWTGSNSPYTNGAGTADNPYLIETADQLAYLAQLGSTNQYFKLMTDIDMDGKKWQPINSFINSTFDGAGHTIYNLSSSLFADIEESIVREIVVDAVINDTIVLNEQNQMAKRNYGLLARSITNSSLIEKCYVAGTATLRFQGGYSNYGNGRIVSLCIGGICGDCRNSTVKECINASNINITSEGIMQQQKSTLGFTTQAAGICGFCVSNSTLLCCVNKGTIDVQSWYWSYGTLHYAANILPAAIVYEISGYLGYCYNVATSMTTFYKNVDTSNSSVASCYTIAGSTFNTTNYRIRNCWYMSSSSDAHSKTESEMKGAAFPLTLNGTGEQLYMTDVTPNVNNGYPLLSFQIVDVITYDTIARGENKMWGDIICSETGEYYYYSANNWGANKNVLRLIVQEIPISLTLSVNNSVMGTVTGGGNYLSNDTVSIIAEANYGYHFVNWSDGIATKERQIVLGTTDSTLIANFAINQYAITLQSNDAALGTVSGAGVYDYQSIIVAAAYPQSHCHFVQWSDGSTINPRYIEVNQDTTFVAIFNKDQHILTVSSGDENAGSVTGSGTFDYYSIVEISATANLGYKFVQWSDGETINPRQILIDQDTSIIAQFEQCKYKLVLTASDTLAGNVYGGGEFTYGVSTNIAAIANEGYAFINWSDGNTDASRSIIMTEDLNLVANFRAITYTVSAVPNDETMGLVIGAGEYVYKGEVQLYAVPNTGYEFYKWSNGVTDNPYSFIATEDVHITAEFITAETSIDNIEQKFITSKIVKDGHIYIIRNGKCFTLQGIEVK